MRLDVSILYRGALSSCNYSCPYCPFAKHRESPAEHLADRRGLSRFCRWTASRDEDRLAIFFTPWGEALVRRWYREAVVELSRLPHVRKVAVQTNLSCKLDWLRSAAVEKVALSCAYHPGEVTRAAFAQQCRRLDELGVRYSVGCVGLREHLAEIEQLRRDLAPKVYLWVNAFKSQNDYYEQSVLNAFKEIDPLFPVNNTRHPSRGRSCRTGRTVFTVDSTGDMRRCHFVDRIIGNIYQPGFEASLIEAPCPNETCGCYIGYVHLDHLDLYPVYGPGVLERIPHGMFEKQRTSPSHTELAPAGIGHAG